MALSDSEVVRLKAELGYNVLTLGAIPYIGYTSLFDQVIQPYTEAGASTTSSTTVAAATAPTPATLVLVSGTNFAAGQRVVIDVDDRQEVVTAQNVSGASLTALLTLAHSGTYPVTVEGGETLIREQLTRLRAINAQITAAASTAGIKQVDVIHFYGGGSAGVSQIDVLYKQRDRARDELASLVGVQNMHRARRSGGQTLAVY